MEQIKIGDEIMEQTLQITNVLADPTRYYIYQYILNKHREVTVQEIADSFDIHPNVARLHLSKLETVKMIVSKSKKTGKGGRPSRLYRLSDEVIQLHFPSRDYQLLAKISLQAISILGEQGLEALSKSGKTLGMEMMNQSLIHSEKTVEQLSFQNKIELLKDAAKKAGLNPEFHASEQDGEIVLQVYNCPFKEIASSNPEAICTMHNAFLSGMFETVFENVKIKEFENMYAHCEYCTYKAIVTN